MTVFFSYDEKRAPTFQPDCPMAAPCGANPWRPREGQTSFTILPSCTTTCYQRSGKGQKKVDKRRSLRLVSHTRSVTSRAQRHSTRKGARGYAPQANPRCHKGQGSWRDPPGGERPVWRKGQEGISTGPVTDQNSQSGHLRRWLAQTRAISGGWTH